MMLKELDELSIGQKLYNYECKSCGFTKGLPEFLIEEFRQDLIFEVGAIGSAKRGRYARVNLSKL